MTPKPAPHLAPATIYKKITSTGSSTNLFKSTGTGTGTSTGTGIKTSNFTRDRH